METVPNVYEVLNMFLSWDQSQTSGRVHSGLAVQSLWEELTSDDTSSKRSAYCVCVCVPRRVKHTVGVTSLAASVSLWLPLFALASPLTVTSQTQVSTLTLNRKSAVSERTGTTSHD